MELEKTHESLVMNVWPDVGRALNISRATAYNLAAQGILPTIRLGRRLLVPRKALEELLASAGKPEPQGGMNDGLKTSGQSSRML